MNYIERQKLDNFRRRLEKSGFLSGSEMISIIGNPDLNNFSDDFWREVNNFASWEETPRVGCRFIELPHHQQVLSQFV